MAKKKTNLKAERCKRFRVPAKLYDTLLLLPAYDPFRDAEAAEKKKPGSFRFDAKAAAHALGFFPDILTHVKGEKAKKPFVLEPWQQAIIANLFGWKRADGSRRYRVVFVYVPKKNGKTAFAAGVLLYVLTCDHEPGAEIYGIGAAKDQAALLFSHATGMVQQQPELASRLRMFGARGGSVQKAIANEAELSSYRVVAADADTIDGANVHMAVGDEIHRYKKREVLDVLEMSTAARRQPIELLTTTADYDRPSICNEKLDYAHKVQSGVIADAGFLPVVYEAPKKADWKSPAVWRAANPNMDVTFKEEFIADMCRKAQEQPALENNFKRLHLNIVTEQASRLIPMDKWDECVGPIPWQQMPEALRGQAYWGGMDLSTTTDLTAVLQVFATEDDDGNKSFDLIPHLFCPRDNAHRREERDGVPYLAWANEGAITLTDGNEVDYWKIHARVREIDERDSTQEIGYDTYNATMLAQKLGPDGDGIKMVPFSQSMKAMSEPTKYFLSLIAAGRIRHGGHPVLRWMASNVAGKVDDNENVKPVKDKEGKLRIDGIVAAIMALGCAMVGSETEEPEIWVMDV